jgi:antitoxin MazE
METHISRWGNSLAIRLPRRIAERAGLAEGTPVDITVEGGSLRITPAAPRYRLDDLLARITPDTLPDEIFDDAPRGHEAL